MNNRIETVARAIHEARAYMVSGMTAWEGAPPIERETALFLAGAALEAFARDPLTRAEAAGEYARLLRIAQGPIALWRPPRGRA